MSKYIGCSRRDLLRLTGTILAAPLAGVAADQPEANRQAMYGLIGKINSVPGRRDALAAILLEGTTGAGMPGCLSYVIASDPSDADALWVTEVWDSEASHRASLSIPSVQAAIAKGRPLIAGFGSRVQTVPIGGYGLARSGNA